ncbi:hypothetical protein IFM46972_09774 [Aspergillus udagawae]|uniref:Uncharacterized protein n=1 Tax=Aspergillus udagawae TaxID=91492 RepID=A0A8H3S8H6_9EURO|nr:hypothetical protein IFM46972_09774 [Aspergillus udagawae]
MAMQSLLLFAFTSLVLGSVSIVDPSDYADLPGDVKDNAIMADYTTDNGGPMSLSYNITGPYYYVDKNAELDHKTLAVNANDTSVLVATHGANVNLSHVEVIKEGYCTWLNQASFFGVNAAINVANSSTAYIENSNITVHNGAANIFAYGTGTTVHQEMAPSTRRMCATPLAAIAAPPFPATAQLAISVSDSVAHTAGIGSAIFYALGEIYAGTVMFSSSQRRSGASISFENSRLTTLKKDMAALWFGNIIATATLVATELNPASGILVIANSSQVTQVFQYFAGSEENSSIQPAEVTVSVAESALEVTLSQQCVQNFTNADANNENIRSRGYNIYYNPSAASNAWLKSKTVGLPGGGHLKPRSH